METIVESKENQGFVYFHNLFLVIDDEMNVGITQYLNEGKTIKVVTKYRYSH